ncbi:uncharacterized protein LOC103987809 [Musa acuminata AAA Group]|uniref:uncharacterized protein LOC103987809 n=1 Tax=Musa acuminata AAA Group TaxID=214697 RepID=UPI0031DEAA5D
MEAIFCLRAAIVPPSTRTRCLVGFHPTSGLAPVRHLSFPRSWRRHHGVSCSQVPPRPPPLEEDEGKKGRSGGRKVTKVAAVGVAVVAACALAAVGLSRGAPAAPALPSTFRTMPTKDNGRSLPIQGPSGGGGGPRNVLVSQDPSTPCNMTVQATRDALRVILFGTKDLSAMGTTNVSSENCFASAGTYDVGICLVQRYIGKKDYHQAKDICEQICAVRPKHDARPCLFKAVIYMMLTVERMLADSPTTTMSSDQLKNSIENDLKDLDKLIDKAKTSWKKYKDLGPFASEPTTDDGPQDTQK